MFLKHSLICQRLNEFTAILWVEDTRAEVRALKVKTHQVFTCHCRGIQRECKVTAGKQSVPLRSLLKISSMIGLRGSCPGTHTHAHYTHMYQVC